MALADYCAMGSSEVTMHEGDNIELLKVGCAGWWFVKVGGEKILRFNKNFVFCEKIENIKSSKMIFLSLACQN